MTKRINSRQKGARGERFIANFFRSCGVPARRGQQFKGTKDSPDVVCQDKDYHIEVKNKKQLQLNSVWTKLVKESAGKTPLLFFRGKDKFGWKVILELEHFRKLLVLKTVMARKTNITQILEYQQAIESTISIVSKQVNILKRREKLKFTEKETESLKNLVAAQKTCLDLIKKYKEEVLQMDTKKIKSLLMDAAKDLLEEEESPVIDKTPMVFSESDFER